MRPLTTALSFAVLGLACALAQDTPANRHPITQRPIAPVMGVGGADWLNRPEREAEEHPAIALDEIGIAKGSVVADVGAGTGFYTLLLADRVGAQGKVYANDIQPGMLARLKRNVAARGFHNVITVLGDPADPKLPANAIDLVLLVDVYHEFAEPAAMLRKIRASLKPDGRLVLLEYRAEDPAVPIRPEHKMTVKQVVAELRPEGFVLQRADEKLPWQHILVFTKESAH